MAENLVYLKNNLEGMSEDERILFIYSELIKILGQAIAFLKKGEIEPRVTAINKAIDVIYALNSILNQEGGIISAQLRSLYLYTVNQLTTANYRKSVNHLNEVLTIFRELQQTWSEKIRKDKDESNNHERAVLSSHEQRAPIQSQIGGVELYG